MSNQILTYPRTRRESEWRFERRHRGFRRGMMSDWLRTDIPLDGVYESNNVILSSENGRVRGGTRLLNVTNHASLPTTDTGIRATKSGSTVTITGGGFNFDSDYVGDYFSWGDGTDYELITVVGSALSATVHTTTAHSATSSGTIRREVNAHIWDKIHKKHVILIGTKAYYAAWNVASWTEIYCVGAVAPANNKSIMRQYGNDIYLWNSNGKYVIEMGVSVPTISRLNNAMIQCSVAGVTETADKTYARRYVMTMAEMLGDYFSNSYNGNTIVRESSPWAIDYNGKDYAEIYTEKPVGDGLSYYATLTSGNLTAGPSDFAVLTNAQVGITANSVTENVITDFTGCLSWADITERFQAAARDFWPTILIYYENGGVVIEMPNAGGTLGYCTAGAAGTDISDSGYLNMRTGHGVLASVALTESVLLNTLRTPYTTSGGMHTFIREYTHYRLYGTKDVGVNGINPNTGKGNNSELFIHIEDVPIIKSFVITAAADGTVTASSGKFSRYDIGNTLFIAGGGGAVITGYTSETVVTWNSNTPLTSTGAAIGSITPFIFSQVGNALTATSSIFDANSVGKRIFSSDGCLILITGYSDAEHVTVADSTTRTSLCGSILISQSIALLSYDNARLFTDTISDDVLSTRISKAWCKNRFWEPLPNCNIGVEIDGFFLSAVRGGKDVYETQLANPYFAGYYDPEFQVESVQDSIQALRVYPFLAAAICSQSTISWSTEITETDSRPGIGSSVTFLAQKKVVDFSIGTSFPESIVPVHEGVDILCTNNCEIRLFNGKEYGPNICEGKIMKSLRKLQPKGAASYDAIDGYRLWGTEGVLTSVGGTDRVPFPDVCWRFAIREEQGTIGGVKYSGAAWLQPTNGISGCEITDDGNRALQVVLDNPTGKFYWSPTYNGPSGSGLVETAMDKDVTGAGAGTEVAWSITLGADTANVMDNDIRHEVSRLTIDPDDPLKAGTSGYDDEGFRDGLEIGFEAYRRADQWASVYSTADNIIKDGDISYDETPEDKALYHKISGNRGGCVISEIANYYTIMDRAAVPNKQAMTENDYQETLSAPVLWLSRNSNLYKNLATGAVIAGVPTGVTGVDNKANSAFQISAALSLGNIALAAGSLLFWADGVVAVTIGGVAVLLSSGGAIGGWTLRYATGITRTGDMILTPSGTRMIEDLRVYNSNIDSDTLMYLYNDMVRNNGDNTLGLW